MYMLEIAFEMHCSWSLTFQSLVFCKTKIRSHALSFSICNYVPTYLAKIYGNYRIQESSIIHPSHLWKSEGNYWSIQESTFSWLNSQNKNKLTNISFFYLLNCMPTYLAKRYGNYRIQESSTSQAVICALCISCVIFLANLIKKMCFLVCIRNSSSLFTNEMGKYLIFVLLTYLHTYSYVPNIRRA